MIRQVFHTIVLISMLLVSNQALAYSWTLYNETNYSINADVSLMGCGKYTDLGWKSVPAGGQQQWLGTGGVSGCEGNLIIDDYLKFSNFGNVTVDAALWGGYIHYMGITDEQIPAIYICDNPGAVNSSCSYQLINCGSEGPGNSCSY